MICGGPICLTITLAISEPITTVESGFSSFSPVHPVEGSLRLPSIWKQVRERCNCSQEKLTAREQMSIQQEETPTRPQAPSRLVLTEDVLPALTGTTLFYPCAGSDWRPVVPLFVPHITTFWFVDTCYDKDSFVRQHQGKWPSLMPIGAPSIRDINLGQEQIDGDSKYHNCRPFIRTEQYRHRDSSRTITVNWCMRRGPTALRALEEPVGVFFYRGDSRGEGGSGTRWLALKRGQLFDVLTKLVDGGLIVTDGSNGVSTSRSKNRVYRGLAKFHLDSQISPLDAMRQSDDFTDREGRQFACVGCIDPSRDWDKGPVLVWRVTGNSTQLQ